MPIGLGIFQYKSRSKCSENQEYCLPPTSHSFPAPPLSFSFSSCCYSGTLWRSFWQQLWHLLSWFRHSCTTRSLRPSTGPWRASSTSTNLPSKRTGALRTAVMLGNLDVTEEYLYSGTSQCTCWSWARSLFILGDVSLAPKPEWGFSLALLKLLSYSFTSPRLYTVLRLLMKYILRSIVGVETGLTT